VTASLGARHTRVAGSIRRGAYAVGACNAVSFADVATLCGTPDLASLEGALFLDTETTGLAGGAGTFVFLLGVASFEGDELVVRQHVLEDPAREAEFLDALDAEARAARSLVTFHGRGFDLPRLEERCLLSRRPFLLADLPHLDLLAGARRVFRLRAGRVGLQHLERIVLGFTRQDDLPGAECPAAWYAYLDGDRAPMDRVLEHNLLDLLALPALVAALADAAAGRAPAHDLHAAGLAFARARREERALPLQVSAAASAGDAALAGRAHAEASRLFRRAGDATASVAEAEAAVAADASLVAPWLALAKHAEHAVRDYGRALECALAAERALFLRSRSLTARDALARRIDRLRRKIAEASAAPG
jgi:uncharacterized protein YprB with RNaseH-like and TPR domain